MTDISPYVLRTYLGHYTLEKFRTTAYNEKNHKCIGYELSSDFMQAFGDYLAMVRGLKFQKRTFVLMKEYEKYKRYKGRKNNCSKRGKQ
jgi:hypothetical protein